MSITAALPEPVPPRRATAHREIEEMLTRIQMYHCSMKAKLRRTCPAMFRVMTTESSKPLDLLTESILPALKAAKSTSSRMK